MSARKPEGAHRTSNRVRARNAVHQAIKAGVLPLPDRCEACGEEQRRMGGSSHFRWRVIYHHPLASYEPGKWLTGLVKLCGSCHTRVHRSGMPEPGTGFVWPPIKRGGSYKTSRVEWPARKAS